MSRLQVLMEERELAEIRRLARAMDLTVADWVRQAIRAARRQQPAVSADRKLGALRLALQGNAPTADIQQMNAEIEAGYLSEPTTLPRAADEP